MAKIMLCDDSRTILNVFEKKLQAAGHEIVGKAEDGAEGFNRFMETKPEIVLLDITMPNKDGRECLFSILEANPRAKVIMVSALKDDDIVKACLAGGAKAFINKDKIFKDEDFNNEVLKTIEKVLKAA